MSTNRRKSPSSRGRHHVIIGNSAAGIAAAREIRRYDPRGQITIISDEPSFGYSRVLLPLYIAGKISKKEMLIAPKDFYSSRRIRLFRNNPVEAIDPEAQRVHTLKGTEVSYDSLLVATGSSPRTLEVPGEDLPGLHYLRKISDAEAIRKDLSSSPGAVLLVGGGLVGVKSLEALVGKKRKVHLVISSDRVLSQMLDKAASDLFLESFRKEGVSIHLHTDVSGFEGKDRLEEALLSDGTTLSCCLAIIGKGVRPNVNFLKGTGVNLNQGITVDQRMATNLPCIYAAGDVAEPVDLLQGKSMGNAIWPLAVEGGRVAGSNMASASTTFSGGLRMNAVEALGTRVVSAGDREGEQQVQYFQKENSVYRKLVFSRDRLTGFLLAGDIRGAGILTSFIKNGTELSPSVLEEGLERGFSFSPRLQALSGAIRSGATRDLLEP
ncbi:MAG: FAD-dependent oxidoreductase [Thermodesulfobacteriota bacterium]